MKNVKLYGVLLICVISYALLSSSVFAEGVNKDFTGQGIGYASVLYDNSNGLPTSEANAICQTKNGFIWIGSYSGLIRYDGSEFERYDSLGISSVVSLYEDSSERLWIGTNDSGVAVYDKGSFSYYGKADGLRSSSIRSIEEDTDGNILIATTLGMAYVDKQNELHILDDPQINGEYICELEKGSDGVIYGETIDGDFFSVDNMRVTAYYKSADFGLGNVYCITPDTDENGCVYLGTDESSVIRANMKDGMTDIQTFSVYPHQTVKRILKVEDKIWICTDNGIGYFDDKMNYNALSDTPLNNSVDDMIVDHEGNLWFVSSRQGVMKIVPCQFTDISKAAGLDSLVTNTTCIYGGDLYVGTDNGLYILDAEYNQKTTPLTEMTSGSRIRSIKTDSKGNLWLCSYSSLGLICLHPDGSVTSYNEDSGFKSNRVRTVTELSDGTIAASTSGGVHFIRNGVLEETLDGDGGLSNTEILTVCEGDGGVIYFGSDGDGIYRLDGKNITRLGLDDGLASEVILRIKKDSERGLYWIITSNSIAYMKDDKITTVKNFPYSNNFDIFSDKKGGVWVLSSNGIYMTGADQLIADEKPEYVLYDTSCGLPSVATANSRNCISEDGTLYIAGTTGISSVNIYKAESAASDVRLTVPFVEADDEIIVPREDGSFVIPSKTKRLTIYGYAITYSLNNPRISYKLGGFDDTATEVLKKDMKPAVYTNLDGGVYNYSLSVINTLTGEAENTVEVRVEKVKAVHEHVLFWIFAVVCTVAAAAAIAWVYADKKTAALLKREKEKEEYIDEMIQAFAMCIDLKDRYTNGHSFRVAEYSRLLAEKLGYDEEKVRDIYNTALLHDIGKLGIPDEVLNKPGRPTDEEYEILKTHPAKGEEILNKIKIAPGLAIGAGYHHERLDGRGYPHGAIEEDIPFEAQIIAVADTFDAMYSTRPYRKQLDISVVEEEIKRVSGTQLNGKIVEKMVELIEEGEIEKVKDLKADNYDE